MKKLIVTIIVLSIGGIGFFWFRPDVTSTDDGTITIVIVDASDTVIYEEEHLYQEDQTLFGILQDTFTLSCADISYQPSSCDDVPMFGTVLLGIDDITTDWSTTYIAIYINNEYSTLGIDSIPLNDGDVYRFEYTLVEEVSP